MRQLLWITALALAAFFSTNNLNCATCGILPIKPVPPVGCKDLKPQCVCDNKGNCDWQWLCVK